MKAEPNYTLAAILNIFEQKKKECLDMLVAIIDCYKTRDLKRAEFVASYAYAFNCSRATAESAYARIKYILTEEGIADKIRSGEIEFREVIPLRHKRTNMKFATIAKQ